MDLIPIGTRNFSVFQNVLTDSGTSPASNSMAWGLNPVVERVGSKALKLLLRMTGATSPLPLYYFIICTEIIRIVILLYYYLKF